MKLSFAGHEAPCGTDRTAKKVDILTKLVGVNCLICSFKCECLQQRRLAAGGAAEKDMMTKHRYRNLEQWQSVKPKRKGKGARGVNQCSECLLIMHSGGGGQRIRSTKSPSVTY